MSRSQSRLFPLPRILSLVVVVIALFALWVLDDRDDQSVTPQGIELGYPIETSVAQGLLGTAVSPGESASEKLAPLAAVEAVAFSESGDQALEPDPSLTGTVAWKDGRPEAGVTVLGWPRSASPSQDEVFAMLAGEGEPAESLVMAVTDEQGHFVLSGVERDQVYLLTAGAPGVLGRWALASASGRHGGPANLLVRAHYAVLVEKLDQHGAPLLRAEASFGPEYGMRMRQSTASAAPVSDVHRALLGLRSPDWDLSSSGTLLSFMTDTNDETVGPVFFDAHHAGFLSHRIEFDAPRTTHGLEVVSLFMDPSPLPHGQIYIELLGWDSGHGTRGLEAVGDTAATLKLVNTLTGKSTSCSLRAIGDAPILLDSVPYGTYTASLLPQSNLARLRPLATEDIVVGPTPATVIFDVRSQGRIEIFVADDVAQFIPSWAMFNVFTKTPAFNSYTAFYSPPYVLEQVTPGDYTVSLYALDEPDGTGSRTVDITVRAGETSTVSISNASSHEVPDGVLWAKR